MLHSVADTIPTLEMALVFTARLSKLVLSNGRQPICGRQNQVLCSYFSSLNNNDDDDEVPVKKQRRFRAGFQDSLRIHVKAGTGGQGLPSKGGIGGRGGDVVIVGSKSIALHDVVKREPSKRYTAETGSDSRLFCLYAENAKPLEIPVPLGISAVSEDGKIIGEINKAKEKVVVARGGAGGCAANGFSAQRGQAHSITLDLKLIADVGFVGFPNAGKSTLLKAMSKANPKIASYPFTTVKPNIGVVEFEDFRRISLADLPGLVEGAHANIGMGHKFLKHVERTQLLLFIVDLHGFQLSPKHPKRTALETIILLYKELELYDADLIQKPAVLALNKCDLPNSYEVIQQIKSTFSNSETVMKYIESLPADWAPNSVINFDKIVPISAAKDPNSVRQLKNIIRQQLDVNVNYSEYLQEKSNHFVSSK